MRGVLCVGLQMENREKQETVSRKISELRAEEMSKNREIQGKRSTLVRDARSHGASASASRGPCR